MQLPMEMGGLFGALDPIQEQIRRARYGSQPVFGPGVPTAQPAQAMQAGILGKLDEKLKPYGGLLGVGVNLLSESGRNGSFGGSIGNALLAGQQQVGDNQQARTREEYMRAQIEAMQRPQKVNTPDSIQEYEYAKQGGYTGTYDQWRTAGKAEARPSPDILEYEYAKAQGYKGTLLDFQIAQRKAGATNVSVNGNDKFGAPPPGFFRPDPTRPDIAPQPNGPADRERAEAERKERDRAASAASQAGSVLSTVDSAIGKVGRLTAGMGGSVLERVPGSTARDLQSELETIKANLGFDRIQQMREQSPTGGALGSVAVQELTALQSTVASLDNRQSPAQLKKSLEKIRGHYQRWNNAVTAAKSGVSGRDGMTLFPGQSPQNAPAESNDDPLGLR
jgi:hypothetical protein